MMHVINGVLYFDATDGNLGKELWKHDPSTDTTSRVKDINPGNIGSTTGKHLNIVVDDLEEMMEYKKGSTQYVNGTLKRAQNIRLFT